MASMASLQLDTLTPSTGVLKSNQSHSPSSNDSGFYSDQVPGESRPRALRSKRVMHKPTYTSVYADGTSESDPRFGPFVRHFNTNRPSCLMHTLMAPTTEEESRPKSPVEAPVIIPTRVTERSASSFSSSPANQPLSPRSPDFASNIYHSREQSRDSVLSQDSNLSGERHSPLYSPPVISSRMTNSEIRTTASYRSSNDHSPLMSKSSPQHSVYSPGSASLHDSSIPSVNFTSPTPLQNLSSSYVSKEETSKYEHLGLPQNTESDLLHFSPQSSEYESETEKIRILKKDTEMPYTEIRADIDRPGNLGFKDSRKSPAMLSATERNVVHVASAVSPTPPPRTERPLLSYQEGRDQTHTNIWSKSQTKSADSSPSKPTVYMARTHDVVNGSTKGDSPSYVKPRTSSPIYEPSKRIETTASPITPKTTVTHRSIAYSELSSTPTRVQPSPTTETRSPVTSSPRSGSRHPVPISSLIEQFSQKNDTLPVQPRTYGPTTTTSPRSPRSDFRSSPTYLSSSSTHESPFSTGSLSPLATLATPERSVINDSGSYNKTPEKEEIKIKEKTEKVEVSTNGSLKPKPNYVLSTPERTYSPKTSPSYGIYSPSYEVRNDSRSVIKTPTSPAVSVTTSETRQRSTDRSLLSPTSPITPAGSSPERQKRPSAPGLDFSIYSDITEDDIIGRPVESEEDEPRVVLNSPREIPTAIPLLPRDKPTPEQLAECKAILGPSFAEYDIFTVNLRRSANSLGGSVGVILSSATTGDQYITVQKVLTNSIADRNNNVERGDRVFFIQNRSTREMNVNDAKELIKSQAEVVSIVLGRPVAPITPPAPVEMFSTVSIDPDRFRYSPMSEDVTLTKGNLGVGLALDGGRGCIYGDRPIVVKRIFEGGSAAKSGKIKVGDHVLAIDNISTDGMSYLEATKTLRSRPEGPVKITFSSRL